MSRQKPREGSRSTSAPARSKQTSKNSHSKKTACFPAPVYAETVLAVNVEDAKRYFLEALIEIHYAHTLMLARQGIMSQSDRDACLHALDDLDRKALGAARYDGSCEDLFFYIEEQLANCCGADVAGKMHTARSRNDIDLTLYRMCLRRELLNVAEAVLNVRSEEHTSELQSRFDLVCRLLLEK